MATKENAGIGTWNLISPHNKPPMHKNVLLAFEEHWNQVIGFRTGPDEYYETSAHDYNSRIAKPNPKWWMEVERVPHHD